MVSSEINSLEHVRLYVHDPEDDPSFREEMRENSCKLCCKIATILTTAGLCVGIVVILGYSVYKMAS